jgi:hypothetical protein
VSPFADEADSDLSEIVPAPAEARKRAARTNARKTYTTNFSDEEDDSIVQVNHTDDDDDAAMDLDDEDDDFDNDFE